MSKEKAKELQEFVDNFNKRIKRAFKLYEMRNKKEKTLKKNFSQINGEIKNRNKYLILPLKRNEENKTLINKSTIWKPPKGVPDYFEELKCLHNNNSHELSIWEKVSK